MKQQIENEYEYNITEKLKQNGYADIDEFIVECWYVFNNFEKKLFVLAGHNIKTSTNKVVWKDKVL